MPNQVNYTPAELSRISAGYNINVTTGQYSGVYLAVIAIDNERRNNGGQTLDAESRYWFQKAAQINAANPNDAANVYIRAVTENGRTLDGQIGGLQSLSNEIGKTVLADIQNKSGVPQLPEVIGNDIAAAIRGGATWGGWGGSFYY
jgi:hypothetical protein